MTTDADVQTPEPVNSAQVPLRANRESRLKYLVAICGPLLLAVGYLWGVVYHAALVQFWGFRSYAPELSTPDVYVQAFWALSSVVRRPTAWLSEMPASLIVAMVLVLVALGCGWAWLNRAVANEVSEGEGKAGNLKVEKPVSWPVVGVSHAVQAMFLLPATFSVLSVLSALMLAPPYFAAQADAKRNWDRKNYQDWDQATWITDTGAKRSGYVHSCSSDECAILDADGFALVVPRERVGLRTNRSAIRMSVEGATQ